MLGGSRELPSASARRILVQSDLSGAIPPKGFETYLTAYPVPEISAYAFARTWYAPEMSRPGCVWTHTLLINNADLPLIDDLRPFLSLFRRPNRDAYSDYSKPVECSSNETKLTPIAVTEGVNFLRAFYGTPHVPIVMADTRPAEFESLFLAIWAQVWPAARSELTISSGSLSARKLDGEPFDLQITPPRLAREVVRSSGARFIDLSTSSGLQAPREAWIKTVFEDLLSDGGTGFRGFLTKIADSNFSLTDVPGVATLFPQIAFRENWTKSNRADFFQAIAEIFGRPDQAEQLKKYCIDLAAPGDDSVAFRWLILELASHEYGTAFSSPAIGLDRRAAKMLASEPSETAKLLGRLLENSLNEFGERIAGDIISALDEIELIKFIVEKTQFVSTIFRLRPTLAANPKTWQILRRHSHEILEAVAASAAEHPQALQIIFPVLFDSGLDHEASHFVNLFGIAGVTAIFEHRGPLPLKLHDRWLDAVTARQELVQKLLVEQSRLTRALVSGAAATLSPQRILSDDFPFEKWREALAEWEPSFSPQFEAIVEVCAFSLALAFRRESPLCAELAALSFDTVHAAGASQTMPATAWTLLEPLVPHISSFKDWDRCERLRRKLISCYAGDRWPLVTFFRSVRQPDTFRDVLKTCLAIPDGRYLFRLVIEEISSGEITPTAEQLAIFYEIVGVEKQGAHLNSQQNS